MGAFRYQFGSMGTACELLLVGDDEQQVSEAARAAIAEVARLDAKYSHYRDDSLVGDINRSAGGEGVELDEESADLIDFAAALHNQSESRFDISAGALTALWDLHAGAVPDGEQICTARARVGWTRVEWRRPYLCLPHAGMRLDLGGVVKEYAADRAAAVCRGSGVTAGLVDLGGDLAVVGPRRDGRPWRIGIRDPRAPEQARLRVPLAEGGFATSGDYARRMDIGGHRYSHILDPLSGVPVSSFASVSVAADSCLVAGAIATVAMLFGTVRGRHWLEDAGVPWLAIAQDGSTTGPLLDLAS